MASSKTGAENRAYVAAHFGLELDGSKDVAMFRSIEGGGAKAEVMTYHHAVNKEAGYGRYRQLGKVKFDDIKLQIGMSMTQPFYDWLQDFFAGKPTRKNGAIVAADFNYKERARRTFTNALIRELTFPKLDASDKNAAYMGVTLAVEDVAYAAGNGEVLKFPEKPRHQKMWAACNFSFKIDGIEGSNRVTKVDSFTIKQTIMEYNAGGFKGTTKSPSHVEFPNLIFYVPEADAKPFIDHMQKRVGFGGAGKGEVRDPKAMHGQLDCYDNSQKRSFLFSIEFFGADIVSVTPDKNDASSQDFKLVKIELYTERMALWYPIMELE